MNQNSGGWRYGNGGSNQFLYRNEEVDNDLLRRSAAMTAAPTGLLDAKIDVNPLDQALQQARDEGSANGGSYGGGREGGTSGTTGIGVGNASNTRDSVANSRAMGAIGGIGGAVGSIKGGLLGVGINAVNALNTRSQSINDFNESVLGFANAQPDPIAALNAIQGWTTTGPTEGALGTAGYNGDPHGGFGADGNTNDGAGGYGGADNGYYKGGLVTRSRLGGPNPRGPDDGYGGLDIGEMVIKKSAVKKHGGLLADINSGKYKG